MISRWLVVLFGVLASSLCASVALAGTSLAGNGNAYIAFIQQDAIQEFDLVTGKGYQIGTAVGDVNGTTFVSFQLVPSGAPSGDVLPITFSSKVIITDIDGDQLFFDNNGTGSFHLGVPGFAFRGSGGPLTGTYVLTGGTGKYSTWKIGNTYTSRAILTNPPSPPAALGTVYVQISGPSR
jgi:hypothetical protein